MGCFVLLTRARRFGSDFIPCENGSGPRNVAAGIHQHLCEEAAEAPRPVVQRGRPDPHRDRREALASTRHHAFEMLLALVNADEANAGARRRPSVGARTENGPRRAALATCAIGSASPSAIWPAAGREHPPTVEDETGRVVVADLRTPGTTDVDCCASNAIGC